MFADRRTVKQKRLTEVAMLHETNPGSEIETGFLGIERLTQRQTKVGKTLSIINQTRILIILCLPK